MSQIEVGTALEIKLDEFVVATGTVTEISEGQVYIDIPATRVVMGLRTSLGELPTTEPEVEHQLAGNVEPVGDNGSDAQDAANAAEPVTPVVVPPPVPEMNRLSDTIAVSNESLRNQSLDSSVLD